MNSQKDSTYNPCPMDMEAYANDPEAEIDRVMKHKFHYNVGFTREEVAEAGNQVCVDASGYSCLVMPDGAIMTRIEGPDGLGRTSRYRLFQGHMQARHPDGHWLNMRKANAEELELFKELLPK